MPFRRSKTLPPKGIGLAFRAETAWAVSQREGLGFTEVVAENIPLRGPLPPGLAQLVEAGLPVIAHGVSLALGSGSAPDKRRLKRLRKVAERLRSPLVSEHLAFVRADGLETEHLLPIERTEETLQVVVDNVRMAQRALGMPLAIENIAALFEWPGPQIPEALFLRRLCEETGCRLLLDTSNLYANGLNFGWDVEAYLDTVPWNEVAYVHTAGGRLDGAFYRDTHAHPVNAGCLEVLESALARRPDLPVLLERDEHFGSRDALYLELDQIQSLQMGRGLRSGKSRAEENRAEKYQTAERSDVA